MNETYERINWRSLLPMMTVTCFSKPRFITIDAKVEPLRMAEQSTHIVNDFTSINARLKEIEADREKTRRENSAEDASTPPAPLPIDYYDPYCG